MIEHQRGDRRHRDDQRDEDARAVGFDEGAKMSEWVGSLEDRGISVERNVLRGEAVAVLQEYAELGGEIYNSRRGGDPP